MYGFSRYLHNEVVSEQFPEGCRLRTVFNVCSILSGAVHGAETLGSVAGGKLLRNPLITHTYGSHMCSVVSSSF